ncbi:hypothetical protein B296_00034465 [Ensete ventricosum]|uniref:Uncharacterized protein n=1 Tax=Ensete ventricosum TaxID=4639 RepID=A0A427A8L0_ENSVE|nr:hypothetical protein B296_00034465 [Ensete ventricosum]
MHLDVAGTATWPPPSPSLSCIPSSVADRPIKSPKQTDHGSSKPRRFTVNPRRHYGQDDLPEPATRKGVVRSEGIRYFPLLEVTDLLRHSGPRAAGPKASCHLAGYGKPGCSMHACMRSALRMADGQSDPT